MASLTLDREGSFSRESTLLLLRGCDSADDIAPAKLTNAAGHDSLFDSLFQRMDSLCARLDRIDSQQQEMKLLLAVPAPVASSIKNIETSILVRDPVLVLDPGSGNVLSENNSSGSCNRDYPVTVLNEGLNASANNLPGLGENGRSFSTVLAPTTHVGTTDVGNIGAAANVATSERLGVNSTNVTNNGLADIKRWLAEDFSFTRQSARKMRAVMCHCRGFSNQERQPRITQVSWC
ncbi:uncharacterized protein LOC122810961 [Protopterus annectens]|uniref:uncharacterized protein LOC122810961 n=1 Tax=Protopterus annectens TaxID=7888 RepID=UPI001CFBDD50|nr:uncharacterized protein LOC122810961 [Protopterus annectens]